MVPARGAAYLPIARRQPRTGMAGHATHIFKLALFAFLCFTGAHVRHAKASVESAEDQQFGTAEHARPYGLVRICFATTRNRLEDHLDRKRSIAHFGTGRADVLTFGCHIVSYPLDAPMGHFAIAPVGDDGFIKLEDRKDHYAIYSSEVLSLSVFQDRVYQETREGRLTVDVHGFNTTHEQAILHAAQLWNASSKHVPIIVFDFSSLGELSGYIHDLDSVRHAQRHFSAFINCLGRVAAFVDIRAHSMGASLVLPGLLLAQFEREVRPPVIDNILLAAPAIDHDNFQDALQHLDGTVSSVLVYCSPSDRALSSAAQFHHAPLVGHCFADMDAAPTLFKTRLDMINVTTLSTCGLFDNFRAPFSCWHNWHRTSTHMLIDANLYLAGNIRPEARGGLFKLVWSSRMVRSWHARQIN